MDEFAMSYEYLIRRAHQCGRHGVAGANADNYRRLQRSFAEYNAEKTGQPKFTLKKSEDIISDYMRNCGEIASYILTAVDKVRRDYKEKLTQQQDGELEEVEISLITPDIEKIQKAIKSAEKTMIDFGLYPS